MNYWQDKTVRLRAFEPSDTEHFVRWDLNSERARLVDYVWPPASRAVIAAWVEAQSNRRGADAFDDAFHWIIENQQRLGFTKEGVHRRMAYTGGRHYDVIWFGMTVEEFQGALMIQKRRGKGRKRGQARSSDA